MHACSYGTIPGILEVIRINKLLLFTPNDRALYETHQLIIHLKKITRILNSDTKLCLETSNGDEIVFSFDGISPLPCLHDILAVRQIDTMRKPEKTETDSAEGQTELFISKEDKSAIEFKGQFLLTRKFADSLLHALPLEHRYANWQLLFSPKIHGISLPSFYRHVAAFPFPSVLVVTDSHRETIFGSFCKKNFENRRSFFGSTENFVFSNEKIFTWTCANQLFQFSDNERIVIGGGPTGSSIVLFDNWLRGVASKCQTFNPDEPLLEPGGEFIVGDVEFWVLREGNFGLLKIS